MKVYKALAAGCMLLGLAGPARTETYPDRPIRLIVSIAAGSITDVITRKVAQELGPRLG
jgi:putative tricarboxylic transport membrane protein